MADKPKIVTGLEDITSASGTAVNALNNINDVILKTGQGIDGMQAALKNTGDAMVAFSNGLGRIVGSVPGLGLVGDAFGSVSGVVGILSGGINMLTTEYMHVIKAGDSLNAVNRELTESNFALGAQFGKSLQQSQEFTTFMLESAGYLKDEDFGFQNLAQESIKLVDAFSRQRLSVDTLKETVDTGTGSFNLYSIAILQANALGLDMSKYASLMSDSILKQGMTVQEATEVLSMYGDIAKDSGISIETVANSLNNLGNNFRKMGLDATFGESFLRGFANTLKETNIGIENAAELAVTFGTAMGNLSTNYGSAFVTAMRGGLDTGSGGALGAGIQMQAKLMDKDANQAEVGRDIALALKDTLAGFTGGNIVSLQDAAQSKDPMIEQIYYTQTQLLKSMYGISDSTDQARVLELLQSMEAATTTGDVSAMESVGKDLQEALGYRKATLSNEEKMQTNAAGQLAELSSQTSLLGIIAAEFIKDSMADPATAKMSELIKSSTINLPEQLAKLSEYREQIKSGESESGGFTFQENLGDFMKGFNATPPPAGNNEEGYGSWMKNTILNVKDSALEAAVTRLASAIENSPIPINGATQGPAGTNKRIY